MVFITLGCKNTQKKEYYDEKEGKNQN